MRVGDLRCGCRTYSIQHLCIGAADRSLADMFSAMQEP